MTHIFVKRRELVFTSYIFFSITLLIYVMLIELYTGEYFQIIFNLMNILIASELMIVLYFFVMNIFTNRKYKLARQVITKMDIDDFLNYFNALKFDTLTEDDKINLQKDNYSYQGVKLNYKKEETVLHYRVQCEETELVFDAVYNLPNYKNSITVYRVGYESNLMLLPYKICKQVCGFLS